MRDLKVLVCGGRDYTDVISVYLVLNKIHEKFKIVEIIEGGAKGADKLGATWAISNNVKLRTFKANWEKYGKGAGHKRNQKMLDIGNPDVVVAFAGGRGTDDMKRRARNNDIPIVEIS